MKYTLKDLTEGRIVIENDCSYETQIEATKTKILLKYPNANIIGVGSNNLTTGIWYIKEKAKIKTFTPLLNVC